MASSEPLQAVNLNWDQSMKWCVMSQTAVCVLFRQAREIVLKYEGRLTRTRGYQAAGADVSLATCKHSSSKTTLCQWCLQKRGCLIFSNTGRSWWWFWLVTIPFLFSILRKVLCYLMFSRNLMSALGSATRCSALTIITLHQGSHVVVFVNWANGLQYIHVS